METYIGQRYVPKIEGVWNQLKAYENLSIVTFNNSSYTSKKIVPEGVDILNENYWIKTGDYIAQVDEFKEEVTAQLAQTELEVIRKRELEDLSPTVIAAIEGGEGTSFNFLTIPQDKSVTPTKTTFIKQSSNLFNKNTIVEGKVIGFDGVISNNVSYAYSEPITVTPGQEIVTLGAYHAAWYSSGSSFIKRDAATDIGKHIFTVPANAEILIININVSANATYPNTIVQVNKGNVLIPYEPYYNKLTGIEVDGIGKASLENKVLFFGATNVLIDFHNDAPKIDIPSGATYLYEKVRYYATKTTAIFGGGFNFLIFNTSKKTFKIISGTPALSSLLTEEIVILVIDTSKREVFGEIGQLEIIDMDKTAQTLQKGISFVAEKVPETFNAPNSGLQTDGTGTQGFKNKVVKTSDIYSLFDNLVSEHPNVLKKYTKGKDSSGLIDFNYYVFKPENVTQVPADISSQPAMSKKLPKLILETGIHGSEQLPVYCIYWLLNGMLNDWKNNEVYEYFRFNTELVIIPVVNPWGFDNYARQNYNGVDLNRNFDNGWASTTSGEGTSTWKGSSPFSEVESQYIRDIMIEHQDALWFADYHNNDGQTEPANWNRLVWLLYCKSVSQIPTATTLNKMSRKYKKQDANVPENVPYLGYMSRNDSYSHAYAYAFKKHNILATIPELFYSAPNAEKDSHKVNAMNYELFVQVILDVLTYTKDKVQ